MTNQSRDLLVTILVNASCCQLFLRKRTLDVVNPSLGRFVVRNARPKRADRYLLRTFINSKCARKLHCLVRRKQSGERRHYR